MKRFILLVIFNILSIFLANAQEDKFLSKEEQLNDFNALVDTLVFYHPNLYYYQSIEDFNLLVDSVRSSIDDKINYSKFYHMLSGFISRIGDGHLQILPIFYNLSNRDFSNPLYGFQYYVIENRLFVIDSTDSLKQYIGKEIISINSIKSDTILNYIKQGSLSYDGLNVALRDHSLNAHNLIPYFISKYFNIYDNVDIEFFGLKESLVLKQNGKITNGWFPYANANNRKITTGYEEIGNSRKFVYSAGLNSFLSKNHLNEYFASIRLDTLTSFILDLRNNEGGFNDEAAELLSYFISDTTFYLEKGVLNSNLVNSLNYSFVEHVKKSVLNSHKLVIPKKNKFNGNLFLLVNGGTYSNGSIIVSHLRRQKNVKVIGSPAGGSGYRLFAGFMKEFSLPNSNFQCRVGLIDNVISGSSKMDEIIIPDVMIRYSLDDIVNMKDLERNYVLNYLLSENM